MVKMRCGSNCARASTNRAQTRSWAAVVFARPSCFNQNMAAHGRCWSRKASQMVIVGVYKDKDNRNSNGGVRFFNITDPLCHVKLCTLLCACSCILLKDVVSSCSMGRAVRESKSWAGLNLSCSSTAGGLTETEGETLQFPLACACPVWEEWWWNISVVRFFKYPREM